MLKIFLLAMALTMSSTAMASEDANLEKAITAAIDGPQEKRLKLYGHHWNVKKAEVTIDQNTVTIKGQISRNTRFWADDQVYYTIVVKDNKVSTTDIDINKDWMSRYSGQVGVFLSAFVFDAELSPVTIGTVIDVVHKIATKSWEESAVKLANVLALEAYKRKSPYPVFRAYQSKLTQRHDSVVRDHRQTRN